MTVINQWAIKLAEVAAPDEIDLAPALADAYQQGGKTRQALYAKSNTRSIAGAFGPGEMLLVLPWILKGIATAGEWLVSLLTSDDLGKSIAVVKDAIALYESTQKESTSKKSPPKELPQPILSLPNAQTYPALKQTIDILRHELRVSGLSDDEADLATFKVVNALLEDPDSGLDFVNCLYGAE